MGKHTGYDIYWNFAKNGGTRLQPSDWASTKASARRTVEHAFDSIVKGSERLVVLAVDPDTGEVVAGKIEV